MENPLKLVLLILFVIVMTPIIYYRASNVPDFLLLYDWNDRNESEKVPLARIFSNESREVQALRKRFPIWNWPAPCGVISASGTKARLGNQMYIHASLYGLARETRRFPIHCEKPQTEIFPLGSIPYSSRCRSEVQTPITIREKRHAYELRPEKFTCGLNYHVVGSLHSFKYFQEFRDELLREEFRFAPHIRRDCEEIYNTLASNCVTIGVHLRRGDFLHHYGRGFAPATASFWKEATVYARELLGNSSDCLRFLVAGDDVKWNQANIPAGEDIVLLPKSSAAVDLCILSKTQHRVFSSGTFGFWSAYLGAHNGTVIHSKNHARPGSPLWYDMEPKDTFPSDWITL